MWCTFLHGESSGEVEVVGAHALLDPLGQLGALVVAVIPDDNAQTARWLSALDYQILTTYCA
jgi:hypothetical protein